MESILGFVRSDIFLFLLFIAFVVLIVLYIVSVANLKKLRISYSKFMNKLGKGDNLEEMMRNYINKVNEVEKKNKEIMNYCNKLDSEIKGCSQKIGIVRYNAFKDTGSDLSFSLAILDDYNNGVVLNGIYARDSSNIYAKPVVNGESKYVLSNEEKEAIYKAINKIK